MKSGPRKVGNGIRGHLWIWIAGHVWMGEIQMNIIKSESPSFCPKTFLSKNYIYIFWATSSMWRNCDFSGVSFGAFMGCFRLPLYGCKRSVESVVPHGMWWSKRDGNPSLYDTFAPIDINICFVDLIIDGIISLPNNIFQSSGMQSKNGRIARTRTLPRSCCYCCSWRRCLTCMIFGAAGGSVIFCHLGCDPGSPQFIR
jgi:hypothetical protein